MIDLTIQFLKRITKLTIKHQGGEGGAKGSLTLTKKEKSEQPLMQFYIC